MDTARTQTQLATVGVIADQLGIKVHRVTHAIRALGLKPAARAGRMRVFDDASIDRIKAEINRTSAAFNHAPIKD